MVENVAHASLFSWCFLHQPFDIFVAVFHVFFRLYTLLTQIFLPALGGAEERWVPKCMDLLVWWGRPLEWSKTVGVVAGSDAISRSLFGVVRILMRIVGVAH
jgi:hypothetical protein